MWGIIRKVILVVLLAGSIAWATCSPQTVCTQCGLTAYYTYSKYLNGKEYGRYTHTILDDGVMVVHVTWETCD